MSTPSGKRWHSREDSGIRLDREGRWWHDDEPVEHPKIVEAFNRGLKPAGDGRFKLYFGNDWCFVAVEDAAYRVRSIATKRDGSVVLSLSDETDEPLDPETLTTNQEGILACRVKQRQAKAVFDREAQFKLGQMLEQRDNKLFLRQGDRTFLISS